MNKVSTLKWLLILTVLLNLCLLAFVFFTGPKHPPHRSEKQADAFLQKRFDFDGKQMELFKISKQKNLENTQRINDQLKKASKDFYLTSKSKSQQKDNLLELMLTLSNELFEVNHLHFQEMRDICRPEQLPEIEYFIDGLMFKKSPIHPKKKKNN